MPETMPETLPETITLERTDSLKQNLASPSEGAVMKETVLLDAIVKSCASNIIFADRDLTLRYMNSASRNTFKKLSAYLPISVDDMVGTSIDVFHKNPEKQRAILADPSNLPIQTEIQLGPETLQLVASAVRDDAGNYIGPMVVWDIVTEEVKIREQAAAAHQRESDQAVALEKSVKQLSTVVEAAAKGDLTQEIPVTGNDRIDQIGRALQTLLTDFRTNMASIAENAQTLDIASTEMANTGKQLKESSGTSAERAKVVATSSEQVRSNVQTVSSAIEQMNTSIREIAGSSTDAANVAAEAVSVADSANETVSKLGVSSSEIGKVVKVINSIAEQTNLLALNATIEAARAGEAGKGFAVVANEVKELAKEH